MEPQPYTPPTRKLGALATAHPHIIGLSYEEIDGEGGPDIQESETGLYLKELDDLNLKNVAAAGEDGETLLDMMQASRRDAYQQLESDVLAGIQTINGPQLGQFVGSIGGQGDYQGVVDVPDGTRVGLTLWPRSDRSSTLLIKRIGLLLAADAVVDVQLSTESAPFTVVATADTPSYYTPPAPIRVRLAGSEGSQCDACSTSPLVISYTVQGFYPRNNSTSCGCTSMDARLSEFFTNLLNQPAYGILLDVEVGEPESAALVDGYATNPAVANVVAFALRYKAAEMLIERIIKTNNINRWTTLDQQYLWGKRNEFRKEYQNRINWLISTDGLRVKPNPNTVDRRPHMGTIFIT